MKKVYLRAAWAKRITEGLCYNCYTHYALKAQQYEKGDKILPAKPSRVKVREIPYSELTEKEQKALQKADMYGCVDYGDISCGLWKPNVQGFASTVLTYRLNYTTDTDKEQEPYVN